MRIDSSVISMRSDRVRANWEYTEATLEKIDDKEKASAALQLTEESGSITLSEDYFLSISDGAKNAARQFQDRWLEQLKGRIMGEVGMEVEQLDRAQELSLVEQILNAFDAAEGKKPRFKARGSIGSAYSNMQEFSASMQQLSMKFASFVPGENAAYYNFTQTVTHVESEATSFTAKGVARTADGREIAFNVDIAMTREFASQSHYSAELTKDFQFVDPLVINVDADVVSVRDQKITFDINADGNTDKISRLSSGSGFLALDKNGDGRINDGGELFGARTGNGFGELAEYDDDGNGWIDEADAVFNDLKVWMQDADGSSRLVALAQADVGAIYLGSASTEFSINDGFTNQTNAVIRRSGIYLKESGGVGTVQHVDFAI